MRIFVREASTRGRENMADNGDKVATVGPGAAGSDPAAAANDAEFKQVSVGDAVSAPVDKTPSHDGGDESKVSGDARTHALVHTTAARLGARCLRKLHRRWASVRRDIHALRPDCALLCTGVPWCAAV